MVDDDGDALPPKTLGDLQLNASGKDVSYCMNDALFGIAPG